MDSAAIKRLLAALAASGFAAWYRQDGKDSWKGASHIHAVWASGPLKPQLREQVASWLAGRTGLVGNANYAFWHPNDQEKIAIAAKYNASKIVQPK